MNFDVEIEKFVNQPYKYGFKTTIETETIQKGLNTEIVKLISKKKAEPDFMLQFRLNAFKKWKKLKEPEWSYLNYKKSDYQAIRYYSAPKKKKKLKNI